MTDEAAALPNSRHLGTLVAFFGGARLNKDGTATLTFTVPTEEKHKLIGVSTNDGMALNIDIHETAMPEGEDWLMAAITGPQEADDTEAEESDAPVVLKKVARA